MSIRDHYDEVFRTLSRVELQRGVGAIDLPDLFGGGDECLWLGFYTEEGLRLGLDRYGLWDQFARLGYRDVRLEIRCDDPEEHLLRIWSVEPKITSDPLLELVARRGVIVPSDELRDRLGTDPIAVLDIEWLQLQRPDAEFTESRPPLPGQKHPGLGLGREILELLRQAAKRLNMEGLVTVPSYFHNAYFYNVEFQYVDPREQGTFLALCRDVLPAAFGSVAAASWAIALRMVVRDVDSGEPFEWFHDLMVAPISERLRSYVGASSYQNEVCEALVEHGFDVFDGVLEQEMESRGIYPLDTEAIATWIGDRV